MTLMKTTIEKIVYPGKSLSRDGGKVILTDEGLPGEVVEVTPIKEKKNYIEGETSAIVQKSPHRIEPKCAHYKICAPYQYIGYPFQIKIKEEQIKEIFSYGLGDKLPAISVKPAPHIWNYRNKIQLSVLDNDGKAVFAYHVPQTHDKYAVVEECELASSNMNGLLADLIVIIRDNGLTSIEEVAVRENFAGTEMLLVLYGITVKDLSSITKATEPLTKKFPLKGITYVDTEGSAKYLIWGRDFIQETIADTVFYVGPMSFFQVNVPMLTTLLDDMERSITLTGKETVADLYCGVGTFGAVLAPKVSKVIGVESSKENILLLTDVIRENQIDNFMIKEGTCEKWIKHIFKNKVDVLVVDPPRGGFSDYMLGNIARGRVRTIVYISCNPSTLIRDLRGLKDTYNLRTVQAYDFFPQTPHVEMLAVLERK